MYLFILESIGMPELFLIGVVALIVFGPRKLPQMAKTIGKTINEFKRAGSEFRSTWEREASFSEEEKQNIRELKNMMDIEDSTSETDLPKKNESGNLLPEVREVEASQINKTLRTEKSAPEKIPVKKAESAKQNWL